LLDAFYWFWIEFGTSKLPAKSFIRPAFDTKKEAAAEEIKRALAEGVKRQAEKLRK
jgi:HK97 gp10 family phage protein